MPNQPRAQRAAYAGLRKLRNNRLVRIYYVTREESTFARHNLPPETATNAAGWYWQYVDQNGPHGPFPSSRAAYRNANPLRPRRARRVEK